jgi:hypothetical protein
MTHRKRWIHYALGRANGLLIIGAIALSLITCGLLLAFGYYQLSKIFFIVTIILLLLVKLILLKMKHDLKEVDRK